MEIADTFVIAGVEVRNFADSHFFRGVADRVENGPGQSWSLDPPAAACAMMLAFAEKMILQPPERRQHIVITPARKAELTPVVVVRGLSPHRDHGVDGGRAADHLAAGIGQRAAIEAGSVRNIQSERGLPIAKR